MNDHEHGQSEHRQSPPEVHREREVIVTNSGSPRSGPGTALVVIFGLVAVVVIAVLAFMFLQREDDGGIIPDNIDVNIQVPEVEGDGGS
jgi:hypothetical protein